MAEIAPGSRLGSYDITQKIGEGGMGEVYRATDTRLKRQVALKVLPASVTADPDRLARFQREAEVLASLNHPNIAGIYGLEESSGTKALVMELVEGPTLADRIAQGPIPLEEALPIARQIADALAAAHDQNIIHRDLKPANIKLRPDGEVKVLDFGLAKAMDQDRKTSGPQDLVNSPTITSPAMTMHGMILGTAAYMSPEQAAARPVDRRTDLWAFGVVVIEMLTGRPVFAGETVSHVIAAVLKDEPDWKALPPNTPPSILRLLRRCLERDRKKRWPDAAAARMECDDALAQAGRPASPGSAVVVRSPWHLAGALLAGIVIASAAAVALWPAAPMAPPVATFAVDLAADQVFTRAGRHVLALSPDGTQLVFVAEQQLFIRALNDLNAKPIAGTVKSDPSEPTFSPDGQWLAFWSNGQLKKIPVTGGTPAPLVDATNPYGITWTGDRIVYAQEAPPRIITVPANGGAPTVLITLDETKQELAQSPHLVAGGRAVLFTLRTGTGSWNDSEIVVQDVASGRRTTLVQGGTDARVLANGYLLYSREDALVAAPFNVDQPEQAVMGMPVRQNVLQSVGGFSGAAQFATSATGTLAFVPGDGLADGDRVLAWMDRQGRLASLDMPPHRYWPGGPALSVAPDGKHAAIRMIGASSTQSDVWILDVARLQLTRLTFTGVASDPVWTRDGGSVCYVGRTELFCQPFDGATAPRSLLNQAGLSTVTDFGPDGTALLNINAAVRFDIWSAPNAPQRQAAPLITTPLSELGAKVSPDGRWIAYESSVSGADEVYVRSFPAVGSGKWQVSTGGIAPRWSRDGRELYYLATRSAGAATAMTLVAVPVASGDTFNPGPPLSIGPFPNVTASYDVMPDGRFLISTAATDPRSGPPRQRVVVVQNWFEELTAKVPR